MTTIKEVKEALVAGTIWELVIISERLGVQHRLRRLEAAQSKNIMWMSYRTNNGGQEKVRTDWPRRGAFITPVFEGEAYAFAWTRTNKKGQFARIFVRPAQYQTLVMYRNDATMAGYPNLPWWISWAITSIESTSQGAHDDDDGE